MSRPPSKDEEGYCREPFSDVGSGESRNAVVERNILCLKSQRVDRRRDTWGIMPCGKTVFLVKDKAIALIC